MPNISEERLAELEDFEAILEALEAGGVDNWEFYDVALQPYRAQKKEEEKLDDLIEELCEALVTEIEQPAGSGCGFGFSNVGLLTAKKILKRFITEKPKN
jgi:hypothetical protein